jgi:hypothetical protein
VIRLSFGGLLVVEFRSSIFAESRDCFVSEPSREDLLGFMDDGERQHFDAPERTEEERKEIWARLQAEWQSIPDPQLDDLKPPYMPPVDWQAHKEGSKDVLPFHTRQWKKQRRQRAEFLPKHQPGSTVPKNDDKAAPGARGDPKPAGVRLPEQHRTQTQQEKRDAELRGFMPPPVRAVYDAADVDHREIIWEANKQAFEAAKRRKEQRLRNEQQLMEKIFDKIQRLKEDPAKAHLLPSANADLHEWYEEVSKPSHRPDYGNPPDAQPQQRDPDPWLPLDETLQKPKNVSLEVADDAGAAMDVSTPDRWLPQTSSIKPQETKTASKSLPYRWFNRYWWFRKLMAHPRWAEGGGLVMAGVIFLKGLDWQIDGAIKTAALAFLVSWTVFSFAIYISSHWDKRRPWMMTAMIFAAVGLTIVWYAYLPQPPQQTVRPTSQGAPPIASPAVVEPKISDEPRVLTDVDPAYLVSLYKQYSTAQADQAVKTYIGKWVKVTGTVSDVTREDRSRETLTVSVSMHVETSNKELDSYTLSASFEDQPSMDRALVLSRKERITVLGKIQRVIEPGILLGTCQFVEGQK